MAQSDEATWTFGDRLAWQRVSDGAPGRIDGTNVDQVDGTADLDLQVSAGVRPAVVERTRRAAGTLKGARATLRELRLLLRDERA